MASRFWVLGTGTWDNTLTTNWAATSGGAPLASAPVSGDTVTFDGNSGGGTVTVNATITISSLTTGAFTGTIDFSANNNNINIGIVTQPAGVAWIDNGSGTHTINMGNGTWSVDANINNSVVSLSGANLTLNSNSSLISIAARANGNRTFTGGAKTFNNVTFNGAASSSITFGVAGTTISTLTLTNQAVAIFSANYTIATLSVTSSASLPVDIRSTTIGTARTITLTNNFTTNYLSLQDITFSGGTNTASNSFDFGNNTGITITGPSGGGSSGMLFTPNMAGT